MSVNADVYFAVVPEWVLFSGISDGALRLYAVLARFADKETGKAFPAIPTLAEKMGRSERTTQRLMRELEAIQAVVVLPQFTPKGDRTSNIYLLKVTPPGGTSVPTPGDAASTTPGDGDDGVTREVLNESHIEPEKNVISPSEFDIFWDTYPRREAKGAAKKAFRAALKQAPFDAILAGAQRYRDDPNREPRFTAHPATWLLRDGWEDDPLPPRNGRVYDRAAELAAQAMGGGGDDPSAGADGRGLASGRLSR